MANKPPDPARQSAGGAAGASGNNFQARAVAWWLGYVLLRVQGRGASFGFPRAALPIRVAAQTSDATDDLRVDFDAGEKLFAQCKTSLSVSTEWPPADKKKNEFAATWIQFYRQIASAEEDASLALVLVVSEASGSIRCLREVLERFRRSPTGTAFDAATVAVTKDEQAVAKKMLTLFQAFANDPDLADFAQHQDNLFRHAYVQVLHVADGESDWTYLDALLQLSLLADPTRASQAMRILSDTGHTLHANRGSLDYAGARKALSDEGIALKDALDLGREWRALDERGKTAQDEIFDTIGRGFRVRRTDEVNSLRGLLPEHRCMAVMGPSGSGKSVVTKDWAQTGAAGTDRIVWLTGAELDGINPFLLRQSLGLTIAPDVLFRTETRPAYLVIDGVDRCFTSDGFDCLRQLLEACRLEDSEGTWHVVFTCDELEWDRVARAFQNHHIALPSVEPLRIGSISIAAIRPLVDRFPPLAKLVGQPDVWKLFDNLKILDLVVTRLENGAPVDASGWVSELQVADWWWQKEIADPVQSASRTTAVLELAKKQGDGSRAAVVLTELSGQAQAVADMLRESRCWKLVAKTRVDFAHDLYGEWSRYQVLRTEATDVHHFHEFFLQRASLPLWHRAIRLYAAQLLETDEGIDEWRRLFDSVAGKSTEGMLVGDVLLEGIAFSSRLGVVMEKLWPTFSADKGALLERFLNRFLLAASAPHPGIARLFEDRPELLPLAKTYHRYPLWGRWIPLLRFLEPYAQFVAETAPLEVAKMAELWFRFTEKGANGRAEMAQLAVTTAEHLSYQGEHDHSWRQRPKVSRVYGAALRAFAEQPARVRELALQLSGRKERRKKPKEEKLVPPSQRWQRPSWWRRKWRALKERLRIPLTAKEESDAMIETWGSIGAKPIGPAHGAWGKAEPWPDGPHFEVSEEFQTAFLTTDACEPMIAEAPELAREILLATLIEEPSVISPYRDFGSSMASDHAGLTHRRLFETPFYDQGPFLAFLEMQPETGLDTLITLINFASEHWAEEVRTKLEFDASSAPIRINGENRDWLGDWRLYYGYRGSSFVSNALVCALMALERWLYERLEGGEDFSPAFTTLLERSRSVGIAGMLVSFGKRDPQLFLGILTPLIGVPEFYLWEDQSNAKFSVGPMAEFGAPQAERSRRAEWDGLPFRRQTLLGICQWLYATNTSARQRFEEITAQWNVRLRNLPAQDRAHNFLPQLLGYFDSARWTPGTDEEGNEHWTYSNPGPPPDTEASEPSDGEAAAAESLPNILQMLELPQKALLCLEGQDETFAADPAGLWRTFERVAPRTSQDGEPNLPSGYAKVASALIAVLLLKCRDWLHAHPDAEQICIELVLGAPLPTQPPTADQQVFAGDLSPEIFYAAALVALWAESPKSPDIRLRVARLAAVGSDSGVAVLCRYAFRTRTTLGRSFLQLQDFIVYAASERSRYSYVQALRDKPDRFDKWLAKESTAFAAGNNRAMPADWSKVRHKQFPLPHSHAMPYSRSTERLHPGLDYEYLVSAFSWVPPLDQAELPDERPHWIEMHLCVLKTFLTTFPPHPVRNDHYEGTPYPKERELLASTAHLLLQLHPTEEPARFWKPLFDLGASAQYWVQDFVTDFLRSVAEMPVVPPRFVSLWSEMLEYASASAAWGHESSHSSLDRERLWRHLLAVDPLFDDVWQKHVSGLSSVWPKNFGLIQTQLRDSESVHDLCHFLRQPFAVDFLGEGIIFLNRLCASDPDQIFDHHRLEDTVSNFLLAIRGASPVSGSSTTPAAQAYRALVTLLAARQNAVAIQLQREYARTT